MGKIAFHHGCFYNQLMGIQSIKKIFVCLALLALFCPISEASDVPSIVMCRPTQKQIQNIECLRNRGLLDLEDFQLICVYHEDENTSYNLPKIYRMIKGISWVRFVAITGAVRLNEVYKENTWTPQFQKIFNESGGIIFTGGMDIPPVLFGEKTSLLSDASTPVRTLYEVSFLFHLIGGSQNPGFVPMLASRKYYPVLGLCLGSQTMNVAAGGTMIQDIPSEIYGCNTAEDVLKFPRDRIHSSRYVSAVHPAEFDLAYAFHRIRILPDTFFTRVLKMKTSDTPYVLSSHHQGIEKLGRDITVIARSMDGKIVEAISHNKYPNVLGVQFHPENNNLFKADKFYREAPGKKKDFNPLIFLKKNPPSYEFHKKIWKWFSDAVQNNTKK